MMIVTVVQVDVRRRTALAGLVAAVKDKAGLLDVIGRAALEKAKGRFRELDRTRPNKMGGKRQHFWNTVARETDLRIQGDAAVVTNRNTVLEHKLGIGRAGGFIKPVRKKWLTIPVIKEAYGMSPREYESGGRADRKLRFWKRGPATAFLSEVLVRGRNRTMRIVFVLKKQVFQKPEPDVLLPIGDYREALRPVVVAFLMRD